MLRPPPTSTLFPYTTLFRSLPRRAFRVEDRRLERGLDPAPEIAPGAGPRGGARARHQAHEPEHQDRKSTRLNSSHLVISYAVFCLKKKKTKIQRHTQVL